MNRQSITCWDITHDGEGERGEKVEVLSRNGSPMNAAEEAAEYFDDLEYGQGEEQDQTRRTIEVETTDGPKRFLVLSNRVRTYGSQELKGWKAKEGGK